MKVDKLDPRGAYTQDLNLEMEIIIRRINSLITKVEELEKLLEEK